MPYQHILEHRAHLLADALLARKKLLVEMLAPKGKRPLFTEQLSKPEALRWWQKHRYDALGKQVLDRMQPGDVMELDQALSQANDTVMEVNNGILG
jgi:hypothetical protein